MPTPKKLQIKLSDLLRDSAYKLTQFKPAQIQALEASITMKETGKNPTPYVNCLVRGKPIKLTPEEIVIEIYLACYARKPSDDELKTAAATFTAEGATRRAATEDVLWSLMNSAEFVFNH